MILLQQYISKIFKIGKEHRLSYSGILVGYWWDIGISDRVKMLEYWLE
jgi:hypothetical protein